MNFHFSCQCWSADWCHVEDFLGLVMADVWIISNCCFFIFMKGLKDSVSLIWIFTTKTSSDGIKSVAWQTFSYGWRFFSPRRRKKAVKFLTETAKKNKHTTCWKRGWNWKVEQQEEKNGENSAVSLKKRKKWSCWKVTSFPSSLFSALWAVLKTCEVFHSLKKLSLRFSPKALLGSLSEFSEFS